MAKIVTERIKFQFGNAKFDLQTDTPTLIIWGASGIGKTFLWKALKEQNEKGVPGFEKFICVSHKTDTRDTLQEKIESNSEKVFVIDDAWRFEIEDMEEKESWERFKQALEESENQFIFLGSNLMPGEGSRLEQKGDTITSEIYRNENNGGDLTIC